MTHNKLTPTKPHEDNPEEIPLGKTIQGKKILSQVTNPSPNLTPNHHIKMHNNIENPNPSKGSLEPSLSDTSEAFIAIIEENESYS